MERVSTARAALRWVLVGIVGLFVCGCARGPDPPAQDTAITLHELPAELALTVGTPTELAFRLDLTHTDAHSTALTLSLRATDIALPLPDSDEDRYVDPLEKDAGSDWNNPLSTPEGYPRAGSCGDGIDNDADGEVDEAAACDPGCPADGFVDAAPATSWRMPFTLADMAAAFQIRPAFALSVPAGARVVIDDAYETWYDWSEVEAPAEAAGFDVRINRNAERASPTHDEIEDHLKDLGKGDIWIYFGHTTNGGNAIRPMTGVPLWRGNETMTKEDVAAKINTDRDPPSVAIVGGCFSKTMLASMKEAGVELAVGFDNLIKPPGMGVRKIRTFLRSLLNDKTVREALDDANRETGGPHNTQLVIPADCLARLGGKKLGDILGSGSAPAPSTATPASAPTSATAATTPAPRVISTHTATSHWYAISALQYQEFQTVEIAPDYDIRSTLHVRLDDVTPAYRASFRVREEIQCHITGETVHRIRVELRASATDPALAEATAALRIRCNTP